MANDKPVVGYIGLGIMGRPAALNLARAGYRLNVFARRAEQAQALADEAGAGVYDSPKALAAACDVVFTNVSDTPDVEEVILGESGVIRGLAAGGAVVDMSTIAPSAARSIAARLAEKNIQMLDAPVSGGEKGAIDGTLSFMVGGEAAAFARLRPLLEAMGKTIVHIGGPGAGQVAKACNQIVIGATIEGVAEALRLARKNGVDPAKVREALLGGFAQSRVMEIHARRMISGDYAPGFKARLHRKDIAIALADAERCGAPLPAAELFIGRLDQLIADGGGDLDSAAAAKVLDAE